jgi:hypothetical protein
MQFAQATGLQVQRGTGDVLANRELPLLMGMLWMPPGERVTEPTNRVARISDGLAYCHKNRTQDRLSTAICN